MPASDRMLQWNGPELLPALNERAGMAGEQYRKISIKLEALKETLGGAMKVIVVTSPLMGDGKTVTAANVAAMLAQSEGRRVCLVDCDARKPRIWSFFRNPPVIGLVDVLVSGTPIGEAVSRTEGIPLDVLALPKRVDSRVEPLPVERMKSVLRDLRERYDFAVCDAPPVLPVAETAALARMGDGILVVVRAGMTPRHAVSYALEGIDKNKLIGFVLNGVAERSIHKYYYRYHAGEDDGRRSRSGT